MGESYLLGRGEEQRQAAACGHLALPAQRQERQAGEDPWTKSGDAAAAAAGKPNGEEWGAICSLLVEPVPTIQSRLIPELAVAGPEGGGSAHAAYQREGQHQRDMCTAAHPLLAGRALHMGALIAARPRRKAAARPGPRPAGEATNSHVQRLLLESVASGAATTKEGVQQLLRSTLAAHRQPWSRISTAGVAALRALV